MKTMSSRDGVGNDKKSPPSLILPPSRGKGMRIIFKKFLTVIFPNLPLQKRDFFEAGRIFRKNIFGYCGTRGVRDRIENSLRDNPT